MHKLIQYMKQKENKNKIRKMENEIDNKIRKINNTKNNKSWWL